MAAEPPDIDTRLAQWRDAGAERLAPLPFHLLRAMSERLAAHDGQAHAQLARRLAAWIETHGATIDAAVAAGRQDRSEDEGTDAGPFAGLLAALARDGSGAMATPATGDAPSPAASSTRAVEDARRAWSRVRARSQLQQSLQQTADDAGPLNSSRLVHRMLARMQAISPGYVQHFVSYMDALAWLDDRQRDGVAPGDAAKPARRRKPRKSG